MPGALREVDSLCDYLTKSRGLGADARSQELGRTCRRTQLAGLNERRLSCVQSSVSKTAAAGGDIESCTRGGQRFEQALQDKTDFDRFDQINTLGEFSGLSRRFVEKGDRLGLLGEIAVRMNELCKSTPPAHPNRNAWVAALEDYRQAGPGGDCEKNVAVTQQAILGIDQDEERAALAAAKSWKQLDSFIERFTQHDVAGVLPQARSQREQLRRDEIAAMRALALNDLERFWRNDADLVPELKMLARQRLVDDSLTEKTFGGVLRAFRVTGDLHHVRSNQVLARTPDDRRRLEEVAVAHTATPGRFFRVAVAPSHGQPSRDETTHAGIFALYTLTGSIPTQAVVTVQRAADAPGVLSLGQYRVHVDAVLKTRMGKEQRSGMLGNADSDNERTAVRRVSVLVGPPTMSGAATVNFGPVSAALFKRGSAGGFEQEWVSVDPVIQVTITGVDVIAGDWK